MSMLKPLAFLYDSCDLLLCVFMFYVVTLGDFSCSSWVSYKTRY